MSDPVAHPPHELPVVAEQIGPQRQIDPGQHLDSGRQPHADGVDDQLVKSRVARLGIGQLQVDERFAQQLLRRPSHNDTASEQTLSRRSGRSADSGTRSTVASSSFAICCSKRPNCIKLSGFLITNSRSTSEPG